MTYREIADYLHTVENIKTKDIDNYNRRLIKQNADVSALRDYVLSDPLVHRTYFQVSMGETYSAESCFEFIEKNQDLLCDWWHVDQLTQFIKKPVNFEFAFEKAKRYTCSEKPFVRRWGYVLFLTGLQKDAFHTKDILSLIKDDGEYYVRMAQAWLIADLAVYNEAEVIGFIENSKIKYNILGKAIQKICDSFRIRPEAKAYVRQLRSKLRKN